LFSIVPNFENTALPPRRKRVADVLEKFRLPKFPGWFSNGDVPLKPLPA
jgi:hypothetical protein